MPQTKSLPPNNQGYTIIEVIIAIAIMVLIVTFSYANVRDFQARQEVASIARQLNADLTLAQESALAGNKPAVVNCSDALDYTLVGIRFQVLAGNNSYHIYARCTGGDGPDIILRQLPAEVSVTISQNDLDFYPLTGGTNAPAGVPVSLGICGPASAKGLTISSTGEISSNDSFSCP